MLLLSIYKIIFNINFLYNKNKMNKIEDLRIEEIFELATKNSKNNELQIAENLYYQILEINPNHINSLNNLGSIFNDLGQNDKAIRSYQKAIKLNPNFFNPSYNLGLIFFSIKEYNKALDCFKKAVEIKPTFADAQFNLGVVYKNLDNYQKAMDCFKAVIELNPNYLEAHNNLGVSFKSLGFYKKAIYCYEKVIEIDPNYVGAYNNIGVVLLIMENNQGAKIKFEKAIEIDPSFSHSYWNLHSLASSIDEAITILKKLLTIDPTYIKAKIMICALRGYQGNFDEFDSILLPPVSSHPYSRSVKWVFSLPKLPKLFFNRVDFFNAMMQLSEKTRPFYEFGVWNGISFKLLINTFKKGFGFDTFTGIPEAWHDEPEGKYSAFGAIPKIEGGEFIVGKFEDTLPKFFAQERPVASLINFDADLYSSTLCALNNSDKVIDENTILIFDEFIINDKWEEDEYKALNEFCENFVYSYEVIAVSFATKQVAVKINKKIR